MTKKHAEISDRLGRGQMFNAYNLDDGAFLVGLGPITDCYPIVRAEDPGTANHLVDVLRTAAGQPACTCPVSA